MTSAGLQTIISFLFEARPTFKKIFMRRFLVHNNDTHPAVAPAEFMFLMDDVLNGADA